MASRITVVNITFTENVFRENGSIYFMHLTANPVPTILPIHINSTRVNIVRNIVMVTVPELEENAFYAIAVEQQAIKNAANTSWWGVPQVGWNFTTTNLSPVTVFLNTSFPAAGSRVLPEARNITIQFARSGMVKGDLLGQIDVFDETTNQTFIWSLSSSLVSVFKSNVCTTHATSQDRNTVVTTCRDHPHGYAVIDLGDVMNFTGTSNTIFLRRCARRSLLIFD